MHVDQWKTPQDQLRSAHDAYDKLMDVLLYLERSGSEKYATTTLKDAKTKIAVDIADKIRECGGADDVPSGTTERPDGSLPDDGEPANAGGGDEADGTQAPSK